MQYRQFPKAKEDLSVLGFGCMRLPIIGEDTTKIDEEKAIKMVRHAIDNGVNYIDTAWPYHGTGMESHGMSEFFVAKALKDGYREKVKIATKLPSWLIKTREDMDKYLDEQLKTLETDCIDYYLVHTLNKALWSHLKSIGVLEFLDSAIKSGKIRFAGFSYHDNTAETFKEIIDAYDWNFAQIQYNYLDEKYQAGKEGLDYAAAKNVGIVIMEPLRGGSLATNLPESAESSFKTINPDRTPVDWSLRWIWNNPDVHVVLSGMTLMEHVEENLVTASNSFANELSETEMKTIEEVKEIFFSRLKVNCTTCGYCMPCPVGVNIPLSFKYMNEFHRFDSPNSKFLPKMMYSRLSEAEKADKCIECGNCEEHCPQSIPIREKLKEVVETFKA
jgi:predicted aldo/keto reductase-like oxidoreductase